MSYFIKTVISLNLLKSETTKRPKKNKYSEITKVPCSNSIFLKKSVQPSNKNLNQDLTNGSSIILKLEIFCNKRKIGQEVAGMPKMSEKLCIFVRIWSVR